MALAAVVTAATLAAPSSRAMFPTIIENATISGNQSSGEGAGVTVSTNGLLTLRNTIVANNMPGNAECGFRSVGTAPGVANLITNNDPTFGCPGVVVTSDPQLGQLQLNSPGDTRTMAIQYGVSPAVDAGDNSTALATDQHGVTRPQGAHSDIGACEAPPPSADLSITKAVSASSAQPGDTVTYTLNVHNAGPNTANSVSVSDTLPTLRLPSWCLQPVHISRQRELRSVTR
jgi:uncharacterized repeat protein (TIGR01451 family)